jgi:predicted DNA-binding transcriptional regulator AlpA
MEQNKIKRATPSDSLINFDKLPATAFVRLPVVCALFAISAPTVWRRAKSGELPAPQKIGKRITAWQVGELRKTQARYRVAT